jgi:hypothetical protein
MNRFQWVDAVLRQTSWTLLLTTVGSAASAAEYFVSPRGSDSNNGTSVASPWRTIAKANAQVRPADVVYLRGGEYVDDPIAPKTSGAVGKPITYTGYEKETAVLTGSKVLGLENAISLTGVSHIVVQRITVDGKVPSPQATIRRFALLDGATYIQIRDSMFTYADGWTGFSLIGDSHHNMILRNRIDMVGEYDRDGEDWGDSIWIERTAHHNLIASNHITHGAHDLLRTKGAYNIVQDNVLDNDWSDIEGKPAGGHVVTLDGTRNVFQRNIVRGANVSIDGPWNQAMKVEGVGNIVRRNLMVDNHQDAFTTEVGSWQRHARDHRIYNNTIYNNGASAWRIRYYENETRPSGSVFMNNLIHNNRQAPRNSTNDTDFWMYMHDSGADAPADNVVINNLVAKKSAGDGRVYFDPPYLLSSLVDAEKRYPKQVRGNIQAVPVFVTSRPVAFRDFELAPGSPGQDQAAPLTTTTGNSFGTQLTVADASYFNDGYGLAAGDLISAGTERNLRVLKVDLTGKRLLLDRSIGWAEGAPVHLEYAGNAPDIGAVESGRAGLLSARPRPPNLGGARAAN